MKYLLDTDTVSFALRGVGQVQDHIRAHRPSELGISTVTVAELRFGAERRRSSRLHHLIDVVTADITTLPFTEQMALRFGVVAGSLERHGSGIGQFDAMIAATALVEGLILVTNNTEHFRRIRGLHLENWMD